MTRIVYAIASDLLPHRVVALFYSRADAKDYAAAFPHYHVVEWGGIAEELFFYEE